MNQQYKIEKLNSVSEIHFELLLLADETREAIEKYIYDSEVYIARLSDGTNPVGIFALYELDEEEVEIKNIAVSEEFQGKGIGSFLIGEIKKIAGVGNYKNIVVGTPDVSYRQVNFYEKNGFVKYGVKKNFFLDNYPEPIIEDGTLLKDMVMLRMPV